MEKEKREREREREREAEECWFNDYRIKSVRSKLINKEL